MLFCLLMFSFFVVMNSFAVVVCRRLVVPGCFVVVLAGGMFHGHEMRPFEKKRGNDRRSSIQEDLQKTLLCGGIGKRAMRLRTTTKGSNNWAALLHVAISSGL